MRSPVKFMPTLAVGALLVLAGAATSFADQTGTATPEDTITVSLWDKGPDSATPDDAHPMGFGAKGAMDNMSMAMLGIKVDKSEVPAGLVTFNVTNTSKDMIHEMIVIPEPADGSTPSYDAANYQINEDAAGHMGEVSELDPGKGGTLTLDLKPGKYLIACNIPAHFMNGMWAEITVH
jgi:uncharacterized cupredoxin-like copper-binding protein